MFIQNQKKYIICRRAFPFARAEAVAEGQQAPSQWISQAQKPAQRTQGISKGQGQEQEGEGKEDTQT